MKKACLLLICLLLFALFLPPMVFALGETEPNNTKETADILLSGIPTGGQLMSENDQDWFSITTIGPDIIHIKFEPGPVYNLVVEDSEGNMLASFTGGSTTSVDSEVVVTSGDTYYIYVTPRINYYSSSPYTLTATLTNTPPYYTEEQLQTEYEKGLADGYANGIETVSNYYTEEQLQTEYEKGFTAGISACPDPEPTQDTDPVPEPTQDIEAFVTRFYQQCLNREPDTGGLNNWVASLNNGGKNGSQLAEAFIFSEEFQNRNTSDSEFVTILYKAFFNREPDTGGYNNWMNKITNGTSRTDVLDGFTSALEFKLLCQSYRIAPNAVQNDGSPNPGGTPSAPNMISLQAENVIDTNTFYNYFIYYGYQGETIYIQATLNTPVDWTSYKRCTGSGGSYPIGISVNGKKKSCNEGLVYTFEEDGTYVFHLGYQPGNSGFFEANVVH